MTLGRGDLKTLANGLFPAGFDAAALSPEGRDEVRGAVDVILKLWDQRNARLSIALEQLDKAAAEIDRLRAAVKLAADWIDPELPPPELYSERKIVAELRATLTHNGKS